MHSRRIREKVKQDYDAIAKAFAQTRQKDWREFELFLPYLQKEIRVLDLGCGNGRLVDFLKPFNVKYEGWDQSEGLLKVARMAHPKATFKKEDMGNLPITKKKWDAIFMVASFHHLPPSDQTKALKWAHVHLQKDGLLLMTNWNLFQWRFWKAWLKNFFWPKFGFKGLEIPWNHGVKRYYYAFTPRELRSLLKRSSFEILREQNGRNFVTIARA